MDFTQRSLLFSMPMEISKMTDHKKVSARVFARLWQYIRPYRLILLFSLLALILATGTELMMPVIVQRTVDHAVIPYFTRVDNSTAGQYLENIEGVYTPEYTYYQRDTLSDLPRSTTRILESQIQSSNNNYFVVSLSPEKQKLVIENQLHSIESMDSNHIIISAQEFNTLDKGTRRILRAEHLSLIRRNTWIFGGLLVASLLFTFFQIFLMALTGQNVMKDLRLRLFSHLMGQSIASLDEYPTGKLVTRVTNDVETINELFTNVITALVKDFMIMAGVIGFLFVLNARLAWIIVATLPPIVLLTLYFRSKARHTYHGIRKWVSRINAFLSEHISGMHIVQIFNRQKHSAREFKDNNQSLFDMNMKEVRIFAVFRPIIDLLSSVTVAVAIFAGAIYFNMQLVTLGVLIAAINFIQKFYQPVMDISEKFTILQSAMAGSERIFEFMDADHPIEDKGTRTFPQPFRGDIEFRNVCFEYKPGEPVLKDLSFQVKAGEMVAIVGYTGAGKTTIINLLTRMWDIQSGQILIDGIDIHDVSLDELRRTVIPVLQDVFLFSGTVKDNIILGTDIPDEYMRQAAQMVQAEEFVEDLHESYATVLNERGSNLSMGQRQLLSFARVIAHDPAIIVLDEATGNIDTETEKLIEKAMARMLEKRTSLVIAHRLSTVQHADRILVLSEGRLAEQGTHQSLMQQQGLYYNLYKLQYQDGV